MRKKKQEQQAAKELWPGAGLWLDWRKITGDDFDKKVEPHLAKVGDTAAQIIFLKTLWTHFNHGSEQVRNQIKNRRTYPPSIFSDDHAIANYGADCREFAKKFQSKFAQLKELERIESEDKRRVATLQKKENVADAKDEPAGPGWNNDVAAIALYALLRMAGLPEDRDRYSKVEVARFARLLTNRSQRNMQNSLFDAATKAATRQAVEEVVGQFEKMGLLEIAAWTRKFYFLTKE
jgi:hypothetical protein